MAFTDLQLKVASEAAIQAAHKNIAKISLFAKSFNELQGTAGQSIAIPVYNLSACSVFDANTNNYGGGINEVDGKVLTLDKHLVKSVAITDRELAETGINWQKDTATALADNLTRGVNDYVFGLINSNSISLSASFDATSKGAVATLYSTAEDNDIPFDRCVVALNPTQYAKVLSLVDYNVIGTGDYIQTGVLPGLFGAKAVVCTSNLPDSAKGAIILDEAIGVASRYLAPMTDDAYPQAWAATDESGFTIGFRRFANLNSGYDMFAADVLCGAKLLQPNKIVRLV